MIDRNQWHKSLTDERVFNAATRSMFEDVYPGFCIACGGEQEGCEPDARRYVCNDCGRPAVFGAQELAISL